MFMRIEIEGQDALKLPQHGFVNKLLSFKKNLFWLPQKAWKKTHTHTHIIDKQYKINAILNQYNQNSQNSFIVLN